MNAREDVLIGRIVARELPSGGYETQELLGSGAMGDVYAGVSGSGQPVAIKFLKAELADDPEVVARFEREARLAAQIRSPYVAAVLCAGIDTDRRMWIVFERLFGDTLEARLQHTPPTYGDLQWIVDDVLHGLADAHASRVIHRDIKPANIFIESANRARVLDFGISKRLRSEHSSSNSGLTTDEQALGTASYMAPEQMEGSANVAPNVDLYALGVVVFRALAGRLPFDASSYALLHAQKSRHDPPTLASTTGAAWPDAVEGFLQAMMARTSADRFASADAARRAWALAATALNAEESVSRSSAPHERAARTDLGSGSPGSTRRDAGSR